LVPNAEASASVIGEWSSGFVGLDAVRKRGITIPSNNEMKLTAHGGGAVGG
jgi:hypothetical protein